MKKVKIVSDPKISGGKPVISGTRISVELIMDFLAAGLSVSEILKEYPELKKSEVLAAIDYAGALVKKTEIYPVVKKDGKVFLVTRPSHSEISS